MISLLSLPCVLWYLVASAPEGRRVAQGTSRARPPMEGVAGEEPCQVLRSQVHHSRLCVVALEFMRTTACMYD